MTNGIKEEHISLNPLGESQREMWCNAIMLYNITIESNIDEVRRMLMTGDIDNEAAIEMLDAAIRVLGNYRAEMVRLVKGVFDD